MNLRYKNQQMSTKLEAEAHSSQNIIWERPKIPEYEQIKNKQKTLTLVLDLNTLSHCSGREGGPPSGGNKTNSTRLSMLAFQKVLLQDNTFSSRSLIWSSRRFSLMQSKSKATCKNSNWLCESREWCKGQLPWPGVYATKIKSKSTVKV